MNKSLILSLVLCAAATSRAQDPSSPAKVQNGSETVRAFIDDETPGWRSLVESDFGIVNTPENTWAWKSGVLHCTGQPIGVLRTTKEFTNFEMVVEWMHERSAGNSGVFVWAKPESLEKLTLEGKQRLPDGIEVQILDHGFTEMM
ncbi:MAG: DUF1080 domain-containing protein, partial [Proteobacteria bacterium]|nr:DUF1080 domain-containing protein [Pseudomonadota bacterium]